MYASAAQLLARYSAEEIAQRADDSVPSLVDGLLLAKAVRGDDLSDYSSEEQAAAAAAQANIERSLLDADSTINGYLASRYQTPVVQAADVLERIACQLARYFLYDDAVTDQVKKNHDDSIAFLRDVSRGNVQLGPGDSGATAQSSAGAEMVSESLVFSRDNSKGFI
ncbi:gp436 family protein [Pseudomonas sp. F(2018)]|uniref:gp436 family protein n=1 Tax=Pseudomonas sp. F(2018) TaxID=2502240 RepID=UPI0010F9ADF8|nr:phage protein Gp36 family protein [Pseudomonas sp. F(2018)]